MSRPVRLALLFAAIAGCQSVPPQPPASPPPTPAATPKPPVVLKPVSNLKPEPVPEAVIAPDPLSLAADCLERGEDAAAVGHLENHIRAHPDQVIFRAQLADLLVRMDRLTDAQSHFELAASYAQDGPPAARRELVHYHTRLMELARRREDAFAEHLHQGIGLYLVAMRLASDGDAGDVERLMCKAAAALKEAQIARPDDARPAWYLYRVWSHLDQPRPADRALRQAVANAPFSQLTPSETRELALAGRPQSVTR
jgi:tetratricopeptide (TPR) repeat protein